MNNKIKIAQAEMFNYLIEEIYKNLCTLYNGGVLSISEVNNINCLLRGKVSQWCDENMNGEEYADYVLSLFEKIKEEMASKEEDCGGIVSEEEDHEGMVWDLNIGEYVYPENLPSHWHYTEEEE